MAENILGLLFVTGSSSGRQVFRYPPDPKSPRKRLTQPIYPSDTYTATDTAVQPSKRKVLFNQDGKSSSGSLRRFGKGWGEGSSEGHGTGSGSFAIERGGGLGVGTPARLLEYGSETYGEEDEELDSDLSEDSDLEYNWMNKSPTKETVTMNGGPINSSRRGSIVTEKIGPGSPTQERGVDRFIESQYNSALNYPLDFLSDMLSPPRSAGNRKFEICVDELIFMGHPVFNNADGKWAYPADPDEDGNIRSTTRGRRTRREASHLGTVIEGKEVSSPESVGQGGMEPLSSLSKKSDSEGGPPTVDMFHLVLILDKPDPKPGAQLNEGVAELSPFDEVYREIAFKWTAAAFALQVRDGYIAREAGEMAKAREKAVNEGEPGSCLLGSVDVFSRYPIGQVCSHVLREVFARSLA